MEKYTLRIKEDVSNWLSITPNEHMLLLSVSL